MLEIKELHVSVGDKEILKGVNLTIASGEIHALMGPNGVGKSTLAKVIGGDPTFTITRGTVSFEGHDVSELTPDERAHLGLFWSFQDPLEIPGLSNVHFLLAAFNAKRKARKEALVTEEAFRELLKEKMTLLDYDPGRLERGLNEGFSGGEKKKNEILQLAVLEPKLSLLDEIDSGLDVDALKLIIQSLKKVQSPEQSYLFITHYARVLELIKPHYVHILFDGIIAHTGGPEVAQTIEARGYDAFVASAL